MRDQDNRAGGCRRRDRGRQSQIGPKVDGPGPLAEADEGRRGDPRPEPGGVPAERGLGLPAVGRPLQGNRQYQLRLAEAAGVRLVFLSPVYATRSHPGAEPLGPDGFAALAAATALPAVALGGMNAERAKGLSGAYGWAGIDAWLR